MNTKRTVEHDGNNNGGDDDDGYAVLENYSALATSEAAAANEESGEQRAVRLVKMVCGKRQPIVLNMFPNARSGWGFLAMNIFVRLATDGMFCPILTDELEGEAVHTEYSLKSVFLTHYYNQEMLSREIQRFDKGLEFLNVPVFHAVPGTFDLDPGFWGIYNIGYLTVEQASFRQDEIARAKAYDFLFSPSSWNEQILRRHGFDNVATVLQGVELNMFPRADGSLHPSVRDYFERASRAWQNKFVVFSGGKMEFRKGQDIVIDAFRAFNERHPDAILVTLWYNRHKNMIPVVEKDFGINSTEPPAIRSLLVSRGVRADSVIPLPYVDQEVIVGTLLRANVSLFTNRAEGATNLLALEAFASETPTIISNNTGHRDIVGLETDILPRCFPLNAQRPVHRKIDSYNGHVEGSLLEGWGESSLEEVLLKMEYIYAHPRMSVSSDVPTIGRQAERVVKLKDLTRCLILQCVREIAHAIKLYADGTGDHRKLQVAFDISRVYLLRLSALLKRCEEEQERRKAMELRSRELLQRVVLPETRDVWLSTRDHWPNPAFATKFSATVLGGGRFNLSESVFGNISSSDNESVSLAATSGRGAGEGAVVSASIAADGASDMEVRVRCEVRYRFLESCGIFVAKNAGDSSASLTLSGSRGLVDTIEWGIDQVTLEKERTFKMVLALIPNDDVIISRANKSAKWSVQSLRFFVAPSKTEPRGSLTTSADMKKLKRIFEKKLNPKEPTETDLAPMLTCLEIVNDICVHLQLKALWDQANRLQDSSAMSFGILKVDFDAIKKDGSFQISSFSPNFRRTAHIVWTIAPVSERRRFAPTVRATISFPLLQNTPDLDVDIDASDLSVSHLLLDGIQRLTVARLAGLKSRMLRVIEKYSLDTKIFAIVEGGMSTPAFGRRPALRLSISRGSVALSLSIVIDTRGGTFDVRNDESNGRLPRFERLLSSETDEDLKLMLALKREYSREGGI
eukprot:g2076.t1